LARYAGSPRGNAPVSFAATVGSACMSLVWAAHSIAVCRVNLAVVGLWASGTASTAVEPRKGQAGVRGTKVLYRSRKDPLALLKRHTVPVRMAVETRLALTPGATTTWRTEDGSTLLYYLGTGDLTRTRPVHFPWPTVVSTLGQ
jgi:hypothetical protein